MKHAWLIAAVLIMPAAPASAQHITKAAVDRILGPAEGATPRRAPRVPGGLGGPANLFAGKPWWAVLQMCSEHRSGAGRPTNAPAPKLGGESERNRRYFNGRATSQFAKDGDLIGASEAEMPVAGWGLRLAAAMNAASASGEWSSDEFEQACGTFGAVHARGV